MIIVIVKLNKERHGGPGFVTMPVECDFASLQAVETALQRGELISGQQLVYDKLTDTESRIRERRPFVFGGGEVRSMQLARQKFLEPA